jgi:ubiquinone/menaquinone biosynthesis C-methylase UbiE
MRTHAETVQQQFDPQAPAYLASAVHAAGPDLEHTARLIAERPAAEHALDLGCGAGHLAFLLAQHFGQVVAADPSPAMLATVTAAAAARGLSTRIATQATAGESLPFASESFDVVATRYSAHHWTDLPRALCELRRVVKPGGALLLIDLLGDESALVDTHLQAMEVLRDPGHVRNRSQTEWRHLIDAAGFEVTHETTFPLRLEFASWIERMRTPPEIAAVIRRLQQGAPRQVCDALAIEPDGSFSVRTGLFWARPR